ncbi:KTSC domain-containing protein [Acinetobacter baumannii]|uniref:KTSC domain-containing protein n=1 Tax=Acinetobacter baumannii TaxID=470 RepID=UPI00123097C6|nr:KTSC domain-containing protein [Acinetobacter baumannii]EKV1654733.1 KTSC domain-containing protein [Acinetobacter baumannii]EKV1844863.1 KTSC domain-containing protein [Acinetobacter baumannii]EKV1973739.1 KTSC domain-containing protein [Acinetobacter baumannii]MDQ9997788.1 KTSC domain-containing protein [Acinetobacter baumannii]MDV4294297.1 KTSC domain-containing protein [Acinetobacter baumannii]
MSLIDDLLKAPENITSIGFLDASDENESRLDVEFDNGVVYQIEGVPRDLYEKLEKAPSLSTFFTLEIFYQYKDKIKVVKPE